MLISRYWNKKIFKKR